MHKQEAGGRERGNWIKAVRRYKVSVIRQISIRNIMYNIINIINTSVCYI